MECCAVLSVGIPVNALQVVDDLLGAMNSAVVTALAANHKRPGLAKLQGLPNPEMTMQTLFEGSSLTYLPPVYIMLPSLPAH
jgi:hypothetical protein